MGSQCRRSQIRSTKNRAPPPSAYADLCNVIQQHRGQIDVVAISGTFESSIDEILRTVGSAFTFFFIDPTGWKGFAMDNLKPLFARSRVEILINFMYDHVNRFLNYRDEGHEENLDLLFGTREWRSVRHSPDRELSLVQLYGKQVRKKGSFPFVTYTRVLVPRKDRPYFHLVYATRNIKGLIEFRKVEEKAAPLQERVRNLAKRDDREERSGQTEIDFAPVEASRPFESFQKDQQLKAEQLVAEILSNGPQRYEKLQGSVLELPLVSNSVLSRIITEGHKLGQLRIDGLGPRERTPKSHHVISLAGSCSKI